MKRSIAMLVALVAVLGTVGWMRQESASVSAQPSACADDAPPMTPAKPVATIGFCRN